MEKVVCAGALALIREHGLDVEEVRADCQQPHVTKQFVTDMLSVKGILAPPSPASKMKRLQPPSMSPRALATVRSAVAPAPKPSVVPMPTTTDPLLLSGCTIEVPWLTVDNKEEVMTGTLEYVVGVSRLQCKGVHGRTQYRIVFQGREPAGGLLTCWKWLRRRPYKVVVPIKQPSRNWTRTEERAMLRRLKSGESFESMAKGLGRTSYAINNRYQRLMHPDRYGETTHVGSGGGGNRNIKWRYEVAGAMKLLGGYGTLSAVCDQVKGLLGTGLEKLQGKAPSSSLEAWQMRVSSTLSQFPEFQKTDEKSSRISVGSTSAAGRKKTSRVWAYRPELAPDEAISGKAKPTIRKHKHLNAKERKKGFDGVPMKL